MAERIKIITKRVGNAYILKEYYNKIGIVRLIDELVPVHELRKRLTHGEAVVAIISQILNGSHVISSVENGLKKNRY